MTIKKYVSAYCERVFNLFYGTVHNINNKDYSKEQLDVWAPQNFDKERWNNRLIDKNTIVCFMGDVIVGFGNIDDNSHIDVLYVHKDYQGLGVATAICEELEKMAKGNITVHSSITAKHFFEKRGYITIRENQVEKYGIKLTNYTLEKRLRDKYRVIKDEDKSEISQRNKNVNLSKYVQKFHINPMSGLLNDPNGFCYYGGEWHLFYQWFAFGGYHGAKNWYHTTSTDLVHWKNKGIALKIDKDYDNRGVYSGNAFIEDGELNLIYTGNHKDENDVRHPYQVIARYEDDKFVKYDPIISMNDDYTEHQRDPKIIKENDKYYLIIGAQNKDKKGRILVYSSKELYKNWKFDGELKIDGYEDFGYMWECPDILKIGDKHVLIFSPQGLEKDGYKYNNVYQNGYMIGRLDLENLEFKVKKDFEELDLGFDFYASQSAFQDKYDYGILCAWMGLPDSSYITEKVEDYSGCLTIPRELSIERNKLLQRPAKELDIIKSDIIYEDVTLSYRDKIKSPIYIELKDIKSSNLRLRLYAKELTRSAFEITYSNNTFSISREFLANKINPEQGSTRSIKLKQLDDLQIFVDSSSVEIFINDGKYTMTSRVFPIDSENMLIFKSYKRIHFKVQKIDQSVFNEFVM